MAIKYYFRFIISFDKKDWPKNQQILKFGYSQQNGLIFKDGLLMRNNPEFKNYWSRILPILKNSSKNNFQDMNKAMLSEVKREKKCLFVNYICSKNYLIVKNKSFKKSIM